MIKNIANNSIIEIEQQQNLAASINIWKMQFK